MDSEDEDEDGFYDRTEKRVSKKKKRRRKRRTRRMKKQSVETETAVSLGKEIKRRVDAENITNISR